MNRIKQNLKYLKIRDFLEVFILIFAFPISLLFRIYNKIRKRNLWLISEDGTTARDNGYYFYKYIKEKHPEEYCYYVIDKKSEEYEKVKKYRDVVHFKSFKHWIYYLSAKWNIVAQKKGNPSKVLFYVLHICLGIMNNRVYLKHGIVKDSLDHHFYENTKFKYFICGAKKEYEYVKENHGYPNGSVVYTGLARFDNLHNFKANKKQILIMPTWRNYLGRETNFLGEKFDFILTDYYKYWNGLINDKRLIKFIEKNDITVLFYMHIEMKKYWKEFKSTSKNIKFLDLSYDIQEILKSTSLLITDFSSVFMDYAYMRKPIVYFQFDKEEYRNSGYREGYFQYERDGFGPVTQNIEETVEKIENYITNDYKVEDTYLLKMKDFFELYDDKNCERIYNLLKKDEKNKLKN